MGKNKKIKLAAIALSLIILLFAFPNLLNSPLFVYLYSYNGTNNGFVNPKKVYEVYIYDGIKRYNGQKYSLKYCKNVNEITYMGEFNDLKIIENRDNITKLSLFGTFKDWSSLSKTQSIENILFVSTNFNDFSLLLNNTNLKIFSIRTKEDVKFCDFKNFSCLEELYVDAPSWSFKNIENASELKTIILFNIDNIESSEDLGKLEKVEDFNLCSSKCDKDSLLDILNLRYADKFKIYDCTFDGKEEDIEELVSMLSREGFNAEFKDGKLNVENY